MMRVYRGKLKRLSQQKMVSDIGVNSSVMVDWNVNMDQPEEYPHGITITVAEERRFYRFKQSIDGSKPLFDESIMDSSDLEELLAAGVLDALKTRDGEEV